MKKKYFCGCDVGSTYGKAVILDKDGTIVSSAIVRSKMDPEMTSRVTIEEALKSVDGINELTEFDYLVGTGYGRNKVPFAQENVTEITCHAMGVHKTNPNIRTIIDIGGQDVKGIALNDNGTVKNFSMNDKCAAGTGKFFEAMANAFELSLDEFSELSLTTDNIIPITAQCSVFAESEVISLVAEKKPKNEIAAGIQMSVAKRCFVMCRKAGMKEEITLSGGCAKNKGLKKQIEKVLKVKITDLSIDPQLMGALGAAEYARKKGLAK